MQRILMYKSASQKKTLIHSIEILVFTKYYLKWSNNRL